MFPAGLISIIIALAIVGLLLWAISAIPMDPTIAKVIRVVIIVAVCIYLIYGIAAMFGGVPLGPAYPLRR